MASKDWAEIDSPDSYRPRSSAERLSSSRGYFLLLILVLGTVSITATLLFTLSVSSDSAQGRALSFLASTGVAAGVTGLALFYRLFNYDRTPRSFRIAMLGKPGVGKSTLIAAMFDEVFAGRTRLLGRRIASQQTADVLNQNIARLSSGEAIVPTTESETMAYRFEAEGAGLLSPRYRIEIGDFPGEETEKLAANEDWLRGTPFFDWALTADAYVMCVDTAPLAGVEIPPDLKGMTKQQVRNHLGTDRWSDVADDMASLRSVWQKLELSHDTARPLREKKVVLAFTRADLIMTGSPNAGPPPVPPELTVEEAILVEGWCFLVFADLLGFLNEERANYIPVLTSSFAWSGDARLGVGKVLVRLLPRLARDPDLEASRSERRARRRFQSRQTGSY